MDEPLEEEKDIESITEPPLTAEGKKIYFERLKECSGGMTGIVEEGIKNSALSTETQEQF